MLLQAPSEEGTEQRSFHPTIETVGFQAAFSTTALLIVTGDMSGCVTTVHP
jgi:hypothetical protein